MQKSTIVILDYGLGNLFSVQHVCQHLGYETTITQDKNDIASADAVILPGVGAFGDAIRNMHALDLVSPVRDFISSGKPFMGVCLGMQLLFSESEEFGTHKGLDIIEGSIKKFPSAGADGNKIRVPQISWNHVFQTNAGWNGSPLAGMENGTYMYFVHSYYAIPADPSVVLTETEYEGIRYCSAVKRGNVFATQFHPEKSAVKGIEVYRNWLQELDNDR
jgi:glutamine amidotransferase